MGIVGRLRSIIKPVIKFFEFSKKTNANLDVVV